MTMSPGACSRTASLVPERPPKPTGERRAGDAMHEHRSGHGQAYDRPERGQPCLVLNAGGVEHGRHPDRTEPAREQRLGPPLRPGHQPMQRQPRRETARQQQRPRKGKRPPPEPLPASPGQSGRVIAATAEFLAVPMMLKSALLFATLPERLARFCANAASLTTSPLPFPGLARAGERIAVEHVAAQSDPQPSRRRWRHLSRKYGLSVSTENSRQAARALSDLAAPLHG